MDRHAPPADKYCLVCGRRIEWRRKWSRDWERVRYCSKACRSHGLTDLDRALEEAIEELLAARKGGASICPSEAARRVACGGDWHGLMEDVRRAARRLQRAGRVVIVQKGRPVDPDHAKGPIRIRLSPQPPGRA